jgi:glycosyltransferase involved in cell wall biosynthesis
MGIKHYKIPDVQKKSPLNVLKIIFLIRKIIIKEDITIIHSHHRMAAFYAKVLTNKKIKKVIHAHNIFFNRKLLTAFSYKDSKIIAVGKNVSDNLVNYFGISPTSRDVIYNAVKPFNNNVTTIPELEKETKKGNILVGNIGRLSKQKGQVYFVEAANLILKKNKHFVFVIVGTGRDEVKLRKLVRKTEYRQNFIFLGYRNDVQNVMKQLDLVVLSSLWEGFPLTPIEAFSVGKTVIGTNIEGTNEIISDGYNGVLVQPKNSLTLSNAITSIFINQEKRKRLEERAYQTFEQNFSFLTFESKIINLYIKL